MRRLLIIAILSTAVCASTVIAADRIRTLTAPSAALTQGSGWPIRRVFRQRRFGDQIILIPSANSIGLKSPSPRRRHLALWAGDHDRRGASAGGL